MLKLQTTRKENTAYALACGYVTRKYYGAISVDLWREHGVYHVRAHDHATGKRQFWESFRTLKEAQAFYKEIKFSVVEREKESV